MKTLILLLAIVAVSCNQNRSVHHYLVQDGAGSMYSMSDFRELKLGDSSSVFFPVTNRKVMIVGEIYGNAGVDSIYSWVQGMRFSAEHPQGDNGFLPLDTNKYITRSTNYAYLVRNWHGQNILAVAADTTYIEFYGKRFYPDTTNGYRLENTSVYMKDPNPSELIIDSFESRTYKKDIYITPGTFPMDTGPSILNKNGYIFKDIKSHTSKTAITDTNFVNLNHY